MQYFCSTSDIYTKLLESYTQNGALQSGKALHTHLVINALAKRTHFASKLIALYAECKQLLHARKLFDKIPKSDIRRWIVLIGAYARRGFYEEAMDMYSKCGKVEKAKRVFYGTVDKDLVALNALLSGCVQRVIVKEALDLVEEIKVHAMKPNVVTYNTLIAGFSQADDRDKVYEVIDMMHDDGLELDVVSWTSIISGLVQDFHNKEAFEEAEGQILLPWEIPCLNQSKKQKLRQIWYDIEEANPATDNEMKLQNPSVMKDESFEFSGLQLSVA
ncbi:hypothetical protein K7X08_020479 [Anisodus acutangulus]|uniref:Pentatricopeptide repeat-containing protein n=1 Tax=Anisodus acutangulus TaxID=402998 RepID=A0A9Q1RCB9_9SOLA|nr:hypothetical protein K7X08_020479 [Anisodus acutangulus]